MRSIISRLLVLMRAQRHVKGQVLFSRPRNKENDKLTILVLLYLVMAALLRAAVDLVILHQSLGQSDASQQILDEVLDSNFATSLLSSRRLQKLLDGDHLPRKQESCV